MIKPATVVNVKYFHVSKLKPTAKLQITIMTMEINMRWVDSDYSNRLTLYTN